jgi:hypothetical protein
MKRGEERRDKGKETPMMKSTEVRRDQRDEEEIPQWVNR